jgi:dynamin 1-like protein
LIQRYIEEYSKLLEGSFVRDTATEMQGGARINYIFHKTFRNIIKNVDPFENLTEADI